MTSVSSRHSSASSHDHGQYSPAQGRRHRSEGSDYHLSQSPRSSRSRSHSDSRSRYRSRSHSRSPSGSRSWSRSRSRSLSKKTYNYRSRSQSRSSSRSSYRSRRRNSFSRSRSPIARSRSRSSVSPLPMVDAGKDPRDRSKRVTWKNGLPCKHVLCYTCSMNLQGKCNRCQKSVRTVERCLVGGIFMCFESDQCRRTYLSQRDLQAHMDHRHRGGLPNSVSMKTDSSNSASDITQSILPNEPFTNVIQQIQATPQDSIPVYQSANRTPLCTSLRSNSPPKAITVGFGNPNKNIGLLPLPQASVSLPNITRRPVRLSANPTQQVPRPGSLVPTPLMQFHTPPPPLCPSSVPPPNIVNPNIPPPSLPTRNTNLGEAVAALAAAAVAAIGGGNQNSPSVLNMHSNQLQPTGLNLTAISNALISANPTTWAQTNSVTNIRSTLQRLPSMGSGVVGSVPPPTTLASSFKFGRFPF